MTVTIYSIGDINYLEMILNALASFFNAKSFGYLFRIGFLVGFILALFKGMLATRIRITDVFVAFLIFWLMFMPKVTVHIEDMYTGSVKTVNHVPIGPAIIGGGVSQIGYRTTQLFETAFSLPNMIPLTKGGFAEPLKIMMVVRRSMMQHLGKANSPVEGADVKKSFVNYIKDCTLTGVALGDKNMDEVERKTDVMTGIAWNNLAFGTKLFLDKTPTELSCAKATKKLQDFVSNNWLQSLKEKLAADAGVPATKIVSKIQDALNALTGGTVTAQKFMLTAAIIPFLEKGIPAYHLDQMQYAAAQMVQQAILQRDTQWAAQYSLFKRYVRPILTFIEGFTYAIGPLVAFAITLGPIAFRVAGMYLMLSLWIQLWMPILAIVNLYIQMAAGEQMAALTTAQYQFPSIAGVMQSDWILQDWIGVAGLLASSAPALAFMILSGSAVAMTHMVGRLEGGDAINEKVVSPDITKTDAVHRTAPMHDYAPMTGSHFHGAERSLPSIDMGRVFQNISAHTRQEAQDSVQQFAASASRSVSETASSEYSTQNIESLAHGIAASHSSVDRYVTDTSENIRNSLNLSDKARDVTTFAAKIGLNAALGGVAGGLSGKALGNHVRNKVKQAFNMLPEGMLSNQYGLSSEQVSQIADEISKRFSDSSQVASEIAKRVSLDAREGVSEIASMGWTTQDIQQISRQASDVIRSTESWNATRQLGERFGTSGSYNILNVSRRITQDPSLYKEMSFYTSSLGLNQDATELGNDLARTYGMSRGQAYAAASVMLMTGYSVPRFTQMDTSRQERAMNLGYSLIGKAMMGPSGNVEIPKGSSKDIFGEVRSRVQSAGVDIDRMEDKFSSIQTGVGNFIHTIADKVSTGNSEVHETHKNFSIEAAADGDNLRNNVRESRIERLADQVLFAPSNMAGSPAKTGMSLLQTGKSFISDFANQFGSEEVFQNRIRKVSETMDNKGLPLSEDQQKIMLGFQHRMYNFVDRPPQGFLEAKQRREQYWRERFGEKRGQELAEAERTILFDAATSGRTEDLEKLVRLNQAMGENDER